MKAKKLGAKTKKSVKTARSRKAAPLAVVEMPGSSVAHGHAPHDISLTHDHSKEKNKRLVMWIGVSVIMTAVVIAWILNLKQLLGPDAFSLTPRGSQLDVDFESLKQGLRETMGEVKSSVQNLETIAPTTTAAPAMTPVTSTITPSAQPNTLPN